MYVLDESGPVNTLANAIAFSIQVIEIAYCKLTGKQRSVITIPCFKMPLLYDRSSDSNNFDTNLIRKDRAFTGYEHHSH